MSDKLLTLFDEYRDSKDGTEQLEALSDLCVKFAVLVDSKSPMIEVLNLAEELEKRMATLNLSVEDYVEENDGVL